jgi:hypothetical protein
VILSIDMSVLEVMILELPRKLSVLVLWFLLSTELFNYLILLGEHGLPAPIYMPASHPVALRRAAVCIYSGLQSLGEGSSVPEAKNDSAKAMWLKLGHIITLDPR